MIYFFIYVACLIAAIFTYQEKYKKHQKKVLIGIGTVLILLAGLRYRVGFDFEAYLDIFYSTRPLPYFFEAWNYGNIERGFLFLNSLVRTAGLPSQALLFIVAALTISILVKSLAKYSAYPMLALLLYVSRFFFVRDMGQIRSSLACVLILYSLESIRTKNLKKFLVLLFLAASFHRVALLGIALYLGNLLLEKKSNFRYIPHLFGASLLMGIINLQYIVALFAPLLPERYVIYLTSEYYKAGSGLFNPVLIMQVGILLGLWIFRERMQQKTKYFNILFIGYFISTCFLLAFNHFGTVAGRVSTLFATFEVIIITIFIQITPRTNLENVFEYIREFDMDLAFEKLRQSKSILRLSELKIINFMQQKGIIQKIEKCKYKNQLSTLELKSIVYYGIVIYAIVIFYLIFLSRSLYMFLPYQSIFSNIL